MASDEDEYEEGEEEGAEKVQEWLGASSNNKQPFNNTQVPIVTAETKTNWLGYEIPLQRQTCENVRPSYSRASDQRLNNEHMAARHVLPKELPMFSGRPEEWPMFISCYERTAKLCAFSNDENLVRLQKCLKGKALEAVRSRLLMNVPADDIINTLRMLYGRPEIIIYSLQEQIRTGPTPKTDKLESIIEYAVSVQNLCATIEASGLSSHLNNPSLQQELTEKLPPTLKLNWAMYKPTLTNTNIATLGNWIMQIAQAASEVSIPIYKTSEQNQNINDRKKERVNSHRPENSFKGKSCIICKQNCSDVANCTKFQELDLNQRWKAVQNNKLCRKCLSRHSFNNCRRTELCGKEGCEFRHHPLLHKNKTGEGEDCNAHNSKEKGIIFRIIPVTVYSEYKALKTYAFLDEGSSLTMIEENLANQLGLTGTPDPLCLKWTGNTVRVEHESKRVSMRISSIDNSKKYGLSNVRTVKSLNLPKQSISSSIHKRYPYLQGLNLKHYENACPQILIGLDNAKLAIPIEVKEGKWDEPIASRTRLGWTLHGGMENTNNDQLHIFHNLHACECNNDQELNQVMTDFFAQEHDTKNATHSIQSNDDIRAKAIMERTTKISNNRFETGLLWRYDKIKLPNSYDMALRRLLCLELKMSKDVQLAELIRNNIHEYEKKGYARKLSFAEASVKTDKTWYLPVFSVKNPNKPNKFRMVWDAAAKVNGISLNSTLLKGPDELVNLVGILQRFRERKIAISGDIKEMFHQVLISKEDQQAHRFLWRDGDQRREPDVFVMQVMTFGATCSPSLAQYIKNTNAEKFKDKYPRAVQAIIKNHYVDDLLDSMDTVEEIVELVHQVRQIHKDAGFEIRNFNSNSKEVENIFNGAAVPDKNLNISIEPTNEKVLGMWWCTESDTFNFKFAFSRVPQDVLNGKRSPTKREVLKTIMSVFDPLGLLAHFTMYAKILMQDIWRTKINWDDEIKPNEEKKFKTWLQLLPTIANIYIPRCYTNKTSVENIQLHIFVDASKDAYAAVAYFRFQNNQHIECSLVAAKTRVAPIKLVSIPRLELMAAVLGATLYQKILREHSIKIEETYLWSDSRTVLAWIRSEPRKYKQFVAFRITEILEKTSEHEWRWIPTNFNVADEATKWAVIPEFNVNSRWFNGPSFLYKPKKEWPLETNIQKECNDTEEVKTHLHMASVQQSLIIVERFSSWNRLVRTMAFVFRYAANLKNSKMRITGALQQKELLKAENFLIRTAQFNGFPEEMHTLGLGKAISKSSCIYKKSPFLDEVGVIRSQGRIDAATYVNEQIKRKIILPKDHQITLLIIKDYHLKYHHQNYETAINEIKQRFTITNLRSTVKKVRSQCQTCKNLASSPIPPQMGDLPKCRLSAFTRPFTFVGVDYFGPISVKIGRRNEKRWGVLFCCMTIRAIHIELAHSLTTDSCIMAIQNFSSRRGVTQEFYSDNGTNFKGASNELKKAVMGLNVNRLQERFTSTETKWIFNPPASPHMGGSWERLVRSVKKNLHAILPTRTPSDELLRNLLLGVENIINSRPLTFVSIEDIDDEALTPNHFLIGSSSGLKPVGISSPQDLLLRKQWRVSQHLINMFWQRWIKEYLPTITRRTKWFTNVKPIEKGDIVLIVDTNNPRNTWPKGIILETTCSRSCQVRSAVIKTASGIYTRPAVKLAVLDVNKNK